MGASPEVSHRPHRGWAGLLMAIGLYLHLTERHEHGHDHAHVHDEHHQHTHNRPVTETTHTRTAMSRSDTAIRTIQTCTIDTVTGELS